MELSQYLELYSQYQASCEYDASPHSSGARRLKETMRRRKALALNRFEANRGSGDEVVAYVSFGRASSFAIVLVLLSNCVDFSDLCVMMGAAASTISAVNMLRHEAMMIQIEG